MYSSLAQLLSLLLLLAHVVPPAIGLVLVARVRTRRRWRTWALLFFGLSLATGLAQALVTGSYLFGGRPFVGFGVVQLLQWVLGLASLVTSGFGVLAVVADRTSDAPPAATPVVPYPQAQVPPGA
ncbi:hypothetical protein G7075_03010 [Phycicoccus sp. HDW14]|uniref:hypothetical protein n=1 Tax=Phycicoccus sp. HDW14 TaxID=2714941 RepID=UPI001409D6FB|nr:hypothetical protein [Phycicoccus sp. HDW14]QIM20351.1 hypothetical protein G7075_03010 [Phycicoccus sp. HDW14]